MILDFSCSNFKSINKEVFFSMQAVDGLPKKDTVINPTSINRKYLRSVQIFGPNGSGKTTLLRGIDAMRSIIVQSGEDDKGVCIKEKYSPHKFNPNEPTTFSMDLIPSQSKDLTVYFYTFSYNAKCITEEGLYYLKDKEYVKIYEREGQNITWGKEFSGNYNLLDFNETKLLLSYIGVMELEIIKKDVPQIEEVYHFFKDDIIIFDDKLSYSKTSDDFDTQTQLLENTKYAPDIKNFIKNICDYLDDIHVYMDEELDVHVNMIYKSTEGETKDQTFTLNLETEESSGVNRLFRYAAAIVYCLKEGKVFIFDELERALHPAAIKYIIQKFNSNTANNAQAIFTTHADISLDQTFVRRDQIWFTGINPDGLQTELYSLSFFRDVFAIDDIRNEYMEGKYKAVPNKILSELNRKYSDTENDSHKEDLE